MRAALNNPCLGCLAPVHWQQGRATSTLGPLGHLPRLLQKPCPMCSWMQWNGPHGPAHPQRQAVIPRTYWAPRVAFQAWVPGERLSGLFPANDELSAPDQGAEPVLGLNTWLPQGNDNVQGLVRPGTFVCIAGRVTRSWMTPISDRHAVLAHNFVPYIWVVLSFVLKWQTWREGQDAWGQLLLLIPLFCLVALNLFFPFFYLVQKCELGNLVYSSLHWNFSQITCKSQALQGKRAVPEVTTKT